MSWHQQVQLLKHQVVQLYGLAEQSASRLYFESVGTFQLRSSDLSLEKFTNMKYLSYWLLLVAFFRLSSVYFGYFNKWALQVAVYSQTQMTEVHGRTFSVWTAMTCLLCVMTAFNLNNGPLYFTTLASFIAALLHFLLEFVVYKTMSFKNFATVGAIASISLVWMLLDLDNNVEGSLFGGIKED